jgi:predicted DNA-binding protein (UPF0251 family)
MKPEWMNFSEIEIGPRKRPVSQAHVSRLIASIKEIGLQTPITLARDTNEDGQGFVLVAGAHRLEALRQMGEDGCYCFILSEDHDTAELWEIDENFARQELTDAQRADHHVRREEILVRRGEVSAPGQGGNRRSNDNLSLGSYASQAADSLGVNRRTVERDLKRGKNIAPDVLADVAGTDLDKGVVLDQLASTPRGEQRAKLAEITLRREEAERIRKDAEAVNRDTDRVIQMTEAESFAEWLLSRTDASEVDTLISWLEGTKSKDVIAALRRGA